jgi:hypothetical protein
MLRIINLNSAFVCLGLSLSLCVACGSSDGAKGNTAGSGNPSAGSGNPSAGSGNPSAGSGNPSAGSGNLGSGGSGPSAGGAPATNSGTFSSGVPKDKQLGSLTDDEAAALCKKLSDYFADGSAVSNSFEEVTCRVTSVLSAALFGGSGTDAALQASCKTFYDTCVASPTTSSESCKKADATCTATTGEYEACVNDSVAQISQLGSAVPTCDKLTVASATALFTGGATASPASCEAVSAKCPQPPSSGAFDPSGAGTDP